MIVNKQNVECCQQNCMMILERLFGKTSSIAIWETCVIHGLVGKNVQPNEYKTT